jgi:hypothetical protein
MRAKREPMVLTTLLVLAAAGCGGDLGPDTLATAADYRFGVEEAARMVAPVQEIPADSEVFEALAEFWVDYSLLALAVNEEGALDRLDLSILTRQHLNQELVLMLRDEVIEGDFEVSDEELATIYETERPGERVRARHILLLFPENAGEAERDSVWALAAELRDRARAGEDFAAMAERYSDDEGSAVRGGDLNFFGRDLMVPPFEEAAFALEPGEVSDVVETQYGLHVIRLEEREFPELDEIREQLREELRADRTMRAESIFVAGIEEPANVRIEEGASETVRRVARDAQTRLTGRDADEALVTFEGGEYTAEEFRWFLLNQPPQAWDQISDASDQQIRSMLQNLTRGELLVREAERRGLSVPEEDAETLREELRNEYRFAAERMGLAEIAPEDGESVRAAVQREIDALMPLLVTGERDIYPLGPLGQPLRIAYDARISRENAERAAERARELREEALREDDPEPDVDPGPERDEDPGANGEPDSDGGA